MGDTGVGIEQVGVGIEHIIDNRRYLQNLLLQHLIEC